MTLTSHLRALSILVMLVLLPFAAWAEGFVEVTGKAQLQIPPDYVQLNIGVDSRHPSAAMAAEANAISMGRLTKFLQDYGVNEKDMRTQRLNLQSQYDYNTSRVTQYIASRSLEVKVRSFAKFDQLLVDLAELGGNRMNSLSFGLDDERAWRVTLWQNAVLAAKHKASVLAQANGLDLGAAVHIAEGGFIASGAPPIYARQASVAMMDAAPVPNSLATANVNLSYQVAVRFATMASSNSMTNTTKSMAAND